MKLDIVRYSHPALRWKSRDVQRIDDTLRLYVAQMRALMVQEHGMGLAANQVGLPFRFFITDADSFSRSFVFINPHIIARREWERGSEGCLSLPYLFRGVKRSKHVVVEAYNLDGSLFVEEFEGHKARVIQHEMDHLNGVLFTDLLQPNERLDVAPQLKTLELEFRRKQESGEILSSPELLQNLQALMDGPQ